MRRSDQLPVTSDQWSGASRESNDGRGEAAQALVTDHWSLVTNINFEKLSAAKARSSFEGAAAVCESKDTHVPQTPAVGRANHGVRVFFSRENLKKLSAAKAPSMFEDGATVCESKDTHVSQALAVVSFQPKGGFA